jgi:hypothetical protein
MTFYSKLARKYAISGQLQKESSDDLPAYIGEVIKEILLKFPAIEKYLYSFLAGLRKQSCLE